MNESIFSRLFRYKQTEKMSPKENYLTEMLAWIIDSLPQFGQDYVLFLNSKCKEKLNFDANCTFTVSAETQFRVTKGIIDMMIETDCGYGFICEHKVDSSLRENQIKDYSECDKEINKDLTFKTVLLTKSKDQHEQNPDIQIIWHDVYEFFSDPIRKEQYKADEKIIIEQFLMYLTEVGMGMKEAINPNGVTHYSAAINVEPLLSSIFNDIYRDFQKSDIEKQCPGLHDFLRESKFLLNTPGKESGRIGIKFSETWHPGLFAGVQLNNKDNSLQNFDSPQLVVIIDCMQGEKNNFQEKLWYKSIDKDKQSKEKTESGFRIQTTSDNPWRVLILHKSLTTVLSQCNEDYYEQMENIKKAIIDGIKWILNCYKLSCEDT